MQSRAGEDAGSGAKPSPSHACGVGPSLSRNAGEGLSVLARRSVFCF
jgi:hypothetical protein